MKLNISFAVRALVALALLVGFYALAIGLAGLLVYAPYGAVAHLHHFSFKLTVGCLAGAFTIVRACLFIKTPVFHAPGPEVREEEQPELFAIIREVAERMGARMPAHVYFIPDVNAFVAEVGGFMGFGTTRVMGIGLGLLAVDDVSGLKATIAHELGHYAGGDTVLGGVVYRTRVAIGRVLDSLDEGWLAKPFELYARLYLRVTHAVSRHQELEADRAGIAVAGRAAHVEGLEREARGAVLFGVFMREEIEPLCAHGLCPTPLYDGFRRLFEAAPRGELEAAIASVTTGPHDTHPALADRIAFARSVPEAPVPRDERPAVTLLRGMRNVEDALEPYLFGRMDVAGALRRIAWDDVTAEFYAPRLAEEARVAAERLFPILGAGPRYGDVVVALVAGLSGGDRAGLARALEPRLAPVSFMGGGEAAVLGRALGVLAGAALVERGGTWKTAIGAPLTIDSGGRTHTPLALGRAAAATPEGLDAFVKELAIVVPVSTAASAG